MSVRAGHPAPKRTTFSCNCVHRSGRGGCGSVALPITPGGVGIKLHHRHVLSQFLERTIGEPVPAGTSDGLAPATPSPPENSHRIQRDWLKCASQAKGCRMTFSADANVKALSLTDTNVTPPAKCRHPPGLNMPWHQCSPRKCPPPHRGRQRHSDMPRSRHRPRPARPRTRT